MGQKQYFILFFGYNEDIFNIRGNNVNEKLFDLNIRFIFIVISMIFQNQNIKLIKKCVWVYNCDCNFFFFLAQLCVYTTIIDIGSILFVCSEFLSTTRILFSIFWKKKC